MILEKDPVKGLQILPQSSRFSNIEELDEEQNESVNGIDFPTDGSLQDSDRDMKKSPPKM